MSPHLFVKEGRKVRCAKKYLTASEVNNTSFPLLHFIFQLTSTLLYENELTVNILTVLPLVMRLRYYRPELVQPFIVHMGVVHCIMKTVTNDVLDKRRSLRVGNLGPADGNVDNLCSNRRFHS